MRESRSITSRIDWWLNGFPTYDIVGEVLVLGMDGLVGQGT
ncbi:hypothetical protein [Bifidobacterium catenulatum]|nr:hypothetical protein [Bifidobacterium catenulatum]